MSSAHQSKVVALALSAAAARPTILLNGVTGVATAVAAQSSAQVYGYWLLDVTLTADGRLVVIEANGTNGATSSIGNGDTDRIEHMASALTARGPVRPGEAALLLHQDGFHHVPEFYARALGFVDRLEQEGIACTILAPGEAPCRTTLNVVVGDIPSAATRLSVAGSELRYGTARVGFATNPNLLPALVRVGCVVEELDLSFFHEGPLALLAHDKAAQQQVCVGTPFTPLWNREAASGSEAALQARELHRLGIAAVVKPHGTSGGTGVRVIPVGMDPAIAVEELVAETVDRYGPGTEHTLFPLRTFEFAQAAPLARDDGPRLWDLRLELMASPGQVSARPVMVRTCPAPFSSSLAHDEVVSNLSHRVASTDHILGPDALEALRPGLVNELVRAGLAWAANASGWRPEGTTAVPAINPVTADAEVRA
ncbi:MAG: hypothetical protein KAG80_06245 [Nocardioides sp.]|nr:hypothetical protein [Nocardioides sp.]